jgi:tetrahydromethanopterin S-methyltransferase subunit G
MDRDTGVLVGAVSFILVCGFILLALTNHGTDAYVLFVTSPIVSALVGGVLAKKVAAVQQVAEVVQHQTDGLLSGRLDHVDQKLDDATGERFGIAHRQSAAAAGEQLPAMPAQPDV